MMPSVMEGSVAVANVAKESWIETKVDAAKPYDTKCTIRRNDGGTKLDKQRGDAIAAFNSLLAIGLSASEASES